MRILTTLLLVVGMCSTTYAQLFPNAFWNAKGQVSSACPGGVCPTNTQSLGLSQSRQAGHWSYPGKIDNHLEGTHGVSTAGMGRQQKLDLHDALHEGTVTASSYRGSAYGGSAVVRSAPMSYSSVGSAARASYGSTGSVVTRSVPTSGSLYVGQKLFDGSVITSIGVANGITSVGVSSDSVTQGLFGGGLSQSDRQFRDALLKAARSARDSGEINRLEFAALTIASRNPKTLANMRTTVQEVAIEEGLATATAIDWDALIAFIEKLIPLIIKLIGLFG